MGDLLSYQNGTEVYQYGSNPYQVGSNLYHFGMDSYQYWSGIFWNFLEFEIETLAKNQVLLESLKCEIKIILSLKMTVLLRL